MNAMWDEICEAAMDCADRSGENGPPNSAFLMSFCLRVVPRFRGNVNVNKPLAACNGTSTQYICH